MSIVKPEPISTIGHILYIFGHMVPQVWGICWALAISKFDIVSPNADTSLEVMPSDVAEVLHAVVSHNPAIVSDFGSLLVSQLREVWLDNPINWSDFAMSQFALVVTNIAFESSHGIVHVASASFFPIIVEITEKLFNLSHSGIAILVVLDHEEECSLRHLKLHSKLTWI